MSSSKNKIKKSTQKTCNWEISKGFTYVQAKYRFICPSRLCYLDNPNLLIQMNRCVLGTHVDTSLGPPEAVDNLKGRSATSTHWAFIMRYSW